MTHSLRTISWNINSVRLRLDLVKQVHDEFQPDILCLQETKAQDSDFPLDDIKAIGFEHVAFRGEKSYNGVAILSKKPLSNISHHPFGGKDDTRHITASLPDGIRIHNFYVPAGGDEPDPDINPKYAHKLRFVEDMTHYFKTNDTRQTIIVGDMNIAPLEHDVWSHKQLLKVVSHTPEEISRMEALRNSVSWIDTHRHFVPSDEKLYSWWSYRNRDWKKSNRGRRLDHIWITPDLKNRLVETSIARHARDWVKPSDHVPIIADIA